VRTSLLVLVLLGVLGGGLWLGYQYTQDQYYVGATDSGQLAIFRGVPGQIAGLDLSSVNETSGTRLADLTAVAQERVKQGIHADDQPDAQHRLAELTDDTPGNPNLKPLCGTAGAAPSVPTTTPSAPVVDKSVAPGVKASTHASTPSAQVNESAPPVTNPVGCRTVN
jgi:PPM family protein phosphatase